MIPSDVDVAIAIAWRLYGTPYIYGGNDPVKDKGLDCSGFVRFILLRSLAHEGGLPIMSMHADWKVAQLYDMFKDRAIAPRDMRPSCLIFYGRDKISHVMMALNAHLCIGAVNGDEHCTTVEKAIEKNARVDIRPILYRPDKLAVVDPFMEINR